MEVDETAAPEAATAAVEEDPYAQFVVGGVYYPKNYTVDARGEPFDPNDLAYYLHEKSLQAMKMKDLYVSSDDQHPHGVPGVNEHGYECIAKPPPATGRAVSVYKNDKTGDYEVMFVTKGTPDGIKMARDIFTRKKQKMSLSHTTEIEEDPETGKIKSIDFTGSHIAVLDEDVHEPGREGCDLRYIVPLYPDKNPYITEFRAAIAAQKLAALQRDLEVVRENINRKNASQDRGASASSSSGSTGQETEDTIMADAAPTQTPAADAAPAAAPQPQAAPQAPTLESLEATLNQLREAGHVPDSDEAAKEMYEKAPNDAARLALVNNFMKAQHTITTINQMKADQKAQAEREKLAAEAQQWKSMFENASSAHQSETAAALHDLNTLAQEQEFGVSMTEEEIDQIMKALPQNAAGSKFRRSVQTACSRVRSNASRAQGSSFIAGQTPSSSIALPSGVFGSSSSAPVQSRGITKSEPQRSARKAAGSASSVPDWMKLSNTFDAGAHARALERRDRVNSSLSAHQ